MYNYVLPMELQGSDYNLYEGIGDNYIMRTGTQITWMLQCCLNTGSAFLNFPNSFQASCHVRFIDKYISLTLAARRAI